MSTEKTPSVSSSVAHRVAMLLINLAPAAHIGVLALCCFLSAFPLWLRAVLFVVVLYVLPPLACRLVLYLFPPRQLRRPLGTPQFLVWWMTANLQAIFVRFPFLEEGLRVVPGLYSAWIRLWGGKVGRLTYWAPGTTILDRSFVEVGDNVVFGVGTRIAPHVIVSSDDGGLELLLAKVSVGDRCVIGSYSVLSAGTRIEAGECTRAFLISPPFSTWADGTRVRGKRASS